MGAYSSKYCMHAICNVHHIFQHRILGWTNISSGASENRRCHRNPFSLLYTSTNPSIYISPGTQIIMRGLRAHNQSIKRLLRETASDTLYTVRQTPHRLICSWRGSSFQWCCFYKYTDFVTSWNPSFFLIGLKTWGIHALLEANAVAHSTSRLSWSEVKEDKRSHS